MPRVALADRHGVVYTPRAVCEPMVRRALEPLIAGRDADAILGLRICDPAIGEGAFLIEIVRVLAEAARVEPWRIAERCIHGVDIDPRAVAAARAAVERFVGAPVPALRDHLRVADALVCDWQGELDAVVGNPPYIRQERLGARKRVVRSFASYHGAADLYVYFIELAHKLARRGGRYCLIVPNKWLTAAYGRPLRTLLSRAGSIEGLVDFSRGLPLFGDADAFPCIVWGTIGRRAGPIRAARIAEPTTVTDALRTAPAAARDWRNGPWHIDRANDAALIVRLATRWPALGPIAMSRGVVTGCNRAFVIDRETRARLVDAEPAATELIRPFIRGRDIRRWQPAPLDRFILLVDRGTSLAALPRLRAHLARFRAALEPGTGRKPGRYRWFELQDPVVPLAKSRAPRLLYQDIQTAPACCLDRSGAVVPDTTVWILASDDPFLLAVLNSPLYGWFARRRFPPALNGAVRPKVEYMRALPLATPEPALHARIAQLVAAQVAEPDVARDRELADAVLDAYELSRAERAVISG